MMQSGLPKDASVNTFHIDRTSGLPDFSDVMAHWKTFIGGQHGLWGEVVRQNNHPFKVYNLADPEPRAPVFDDTWSFTTAPVGETLPTEVSLCISYQAAKVSGEKQANKRGRIYLPPFDIQWTVDGRPNSTMLEDLTTGFHTFIDNLNGDGYYFVVYSRELEQTFVVEEVWVDNSWDTQRRRGQEPTLRQSTGIFTQTLP